MARCHECNYMHQPNNDKEHYFCLKKRDYIERDIDKNIRCRDYQPLSKDK
jgi:hypothetical protein